jgi:hypothetical protein
VAKALVRTLTVQISNKPRGRTQLAHASDFSPACQQRTGHSTLMEHTFQAFRGNQNTRVRSAVRNRATLECKKKHNVMKLFDDVQQLNLLLGLKANQSEVNHNNFR